MPIEFKASFNLTEARERTAEFLKQYPQLAEAVNDFRNNLLSNNLNNQYSNHEDFVDANIADLLCLSKKYTLSDGSTTTSIAPDFFSSQNQKSLNLIKEKAAPLFDTIKSNASQDPFLNTIVARFFFDGIGVEKDLTKSFEHYKLAADKGLAIAQLYLGMRYLNGEGVEKNLTEAFRYFKLSADQGYANSQFNIGACYYNGEGVEKDNAKALEYFELAADKGAMIAQSTLGRFYYNGIGVKKNPVKAFEYYKMAADQGDATAQCAVGIRYSIGEGVEKNAAKSYLYFARSLNNNFKIESSLVALLFDDHQAFVASENRISGLLSPLFNDLKTCSALSKSEICEIIDAKISVLEKQQNKFGPLRDLFAYGNLGTLEKIIKISNEADALSITDLLEIHQKITEAPDKKMSKSALGSTVAQCLTNKIGKELDLEIENFSFDRTNLGCTFGEKSSKKKPVKTSNAALTEPMMSRSELTSDSIAQGRRIDDIEQEIKNAGFPVNLIANGEKVQLTMSMTTTQTNDTTLNPFSKKPAEANTKKSVSAEVVMTPNPLFESHFGKEEKETSPTTKTKELRSFSSSIPALTPAIKSPLSSKLKPITQLQKIPEGKEEKEEPSSSPVNTKTKLPSKLPPLKIPGGNSKLS